SHHIALRIQQIVLHDAGDQRKLHHDQEDHRRDEAEYRVLHVDGAEFAAVHATLQDTADEIGARPDHFLLVEGGELGEVARLADHQLGDARSARRADTLPPDAHAVAHHV